MPKRSNLNVQKHNKQQPGQYVITSTQSSHYRKPYIVSTTEAQEKVLNADRMKMKVLKEEINKSPKEIQETNTQIKKLEEISKSIKEHQERKKNNIQKNK